MADEKEKARKAEAELYAEEQRKAGEALKKAQMGASKQPTPSSDVKYLAEHTVAADETLSHIALKYYGNAGREFWMYIYEANKAVIGDNPGMIRPGIVLKIPEKK